MDNLCIEYTMTKSCWTFILALALIPLDTEIAFAELFSSKINGNTQSWALSPADEIQVAQAIPEPGDPAVHSTSFPDFESRFAKGQYTFGLSLGYGFSINLPAETGVSGQRTEIRAIHFLPNFKYNLTGLMGESIFRGALYWVIEAGAIVTVADSKREGQTVAQAPDYMFGLVPARLEYKFLNPGRNWAPFLFAGVGGAWGNFFRGSEEIATAFEFILEGGAGIEYFFDNGTALNFNYRLWHFSNSGIKGRNVGINAHVFSLGFSF
jgi:opacity protein-like surface antigen